MAKTNYTKVEEILVEGLRKMSMQHLLEIADQTEEQTKLTHEQHVVLIPEARRLVIAALKQDLKLLKKEKVKFEDKIGLRKKGIQKLIDHPETLTPEDWEKIKEIQHKIAEFKKEWMKQLPISSDEQIVASERIRHVNKRYNTNERWLPLH